MCYIANVGDSRAIASFEQGRKSIALSRDHKPCDRDEQKRITSFGGKIYQYRVVLFFSNQYLEAKFINLADSLGQKCF